MSAFDVTQILTGDPLTDALLVAMTENDDEAGFVADKIAPITYQPKKKGSFPVLGYADKVKNTAPRQDDQPAPSTLKMVLNQIEYECESFDERVLFTETEEQTDQVKSEYLKQGVVMALANLMKLKKELKLKDKISTSANYASGFYNTVGSSDQFGHADADPVKYILTKADTMRKKTGVLMDSLFMPHPTYNAFINNAKVRAALPDNLHHGVAKESDIIPLLKTGPLKQLNNIIIGGAVHDSNTNKTTRNGTDVWDDICIIFKKAKVDYTSGLVTAGAFAGVVNTHPKNLGAMEYDPANKEKGTWLEDRYNYDPIIYKIGGTDPLAYLLLDCVA